MSRRLAEYPDSQKSLALTTARRIAEFLGPQMVKDKGLACHFVISRTPVGKPVTDRAIPLNIFKADPAVRIHFLRKWTGDYSLAPDAGLKAILDWEYYIGRFQGTIQKIITIPAAFQGVTNPVPRVKHPEWLHKRIQQMNSKYKQISLTTMFSKLNQRQPHEIEDIKADYGNKKSTVITELSSDEEDERAHNSDDDIQDHRNAAENLERERIREEAERVAKERVKAFEAKYFGQHSKQPMDNAFFGDKAFSGWLKKSKAIWAERAKLRKEIFGQADAATASAPKDNNDGGDDDNSERRPEKTANVTIDNMMIDTRSKALTTAWQILEVRPVSYRNDLVTVFALLDRTLHTFTVHVDNVVVIDADPTLTAGQIPFGKPVSGRVLPRRVEAGQLYELTIPGSQGTDFLEKLQTSREDIRTVYESHIPATSRLITQVGAVVSVDRKLHLSRNHRRGEFSLNELDASSNARYLFPNIPHVFIYHATADVRGIMAAVYRAANEALVVIVQPAAAQRPNLPWGTFIEEALESAMPKDLQDKNAERVAQYKALNVTVQYVTDVKAGAALIQQSIKESIDHGAHHQRPCFATVQSSSSVVSLSTIIPQLTQMAAMKMQGAADDEKVFSAHALNWVRPLCKRMLARYFVANEHVEERVATASLANVPVCNLQQDTSVSALDYLFSRLLKRHSHVLWSPQELNYASEPIEEAPREIVYPGGSHGWLAEFSVDQVAVVSVLFSQTLQETDDPHAASLMPGDVTSHFHVLRELLSELYGIVAKRDTAATSILKRDAAMTLLISFPRWLKDTMSTCYEPNLVAYVGRLIHRALTALLLRMVKIGGLIVRATPERVVVFTKKHSLVDAIGFGKFALSSLADQPMFTHLNLQVTRYWCPTIQITLRDYAGLYMPAANAASSIHLALPDPTLMQFEMQGALWSRLLPHTREVLAMRLRECVALMATVKNSVIQALDKNPTATLATRAEQLSAMFSKEFNAVLEKDFQRVILKDVSDLIADRVQLASSTSLSDTAAAVEYAKILTHYIGLVPGCAHLAEAILNSCLLLCRVGTHSQEAIFQPDPRERHLYLRFYCSFCCEECSLYLGQSSGEASTQWKCNTCHNAFTKDSVETRLIADLNRCINSHLNTDLECAKCKCTSSSLIANNCCGNLRPKDSKLSQVIDVMVHVAKIHSMPLLGETTSVALMCL